MLNEITKVNFGTIREAAQDGENITIIINGQYYDLDAGTPAGTDPFIEGVKFAASVIEDRQARFNFVSRHTAKTKKAREANAKETEYAKGILKHLEYITTEINSYRTLYNDYVHGNLWRLEK